MSWPNLLQVRLVRGLAAACALLWASACQWSSAPHVPSPGLVRFEADDSEVLPTIADGDWLAAWPAWLHSCDALLSKARTAQRAWVNVCADARVLRPSTGAQVRDFFRQRMDRYRVVALGPGPETIEAARVRPGATQPGAVHESASGLVTGYFEPVLEGSRQRSAVFVAPVYRAPAVLPTAARSDLETTGQLQGQELVWLRDPMEAFELEVQGSGRIHLTDGSFMRLAYAANNGHAYRSVGRWLIDQGEVDPQAMSLQAIEQWAHAHPQRVRELLDQNPRVVFFREVPMGDVDAQPVGTLGVPLTPQISVAVDARCLPLGAPLVLQTESPTDGEPIARIVLAQDTGAAIRGALRIDWYWGEGSDAARIAGRLHAPGSVRVFVPRGVVPADLL